MLPKSIIVLDFGSQYTHLIARRIRELGVYSEILPFDYPLSALVKLDPSGIVFGGGPISVYVKGAPSISKKVYELGIPILGICYGMQITAHLLGGRVKKGKHKEYGPADIERIGPSKLLNNYPAKANVWMNHFDQVVELPKGFKAIAKSPATKFTAVEDKKRKIHLVQFHPEVSHTTQGKSILKNFVFDICKAKKNWQLGDFIKQTVREVKARVGTDKVICALSGGVDSSVAATLINKAIGKKLHCIFVDTGLMRDGEAQKVKRTFEKHQKMNLKVVRAEKEFLKALDGVTDPEKKRKIIGEKFIRIFEREAKKIKGVKFLVQGTLYPDVITSGVSISKKADTIKSHHNVGGLPKNFDFELIEPFRYLFKDEVRKIGEKLRLPDEIVWRHPFPGPGLAVRIIGKITKEKANMLRKADVIIEEEIRKAGLYKKLWMCFSILPGVKTVGIKGEERAYDDLLAIRGLESKDAMTGDWARIPHEVLAKISARIPNEVPGVNRVVYDITSKPPAMMEWE